MELRVINVFCLLTTLQTIIGESLYYKLPKDHDPSKEIRGNSFGLENFLLQQAYKEVDSVAPHNEAPPPKRTRGKETYRKKEVVGTRGQTYGLENLAPSLYDLGHLPLGVSELVTDFRPVTEEPKRRPAESVYVPRVVDTEERRERNKLRKPGKQIRRPVTSTTTPSPVQIHNQLSNKPGLEEEVTEQPQSINETILPVAEASYAVAKTQETPTAEKDAEQQRETGKQRPRKRVTMRRRRKRPQSFSDVDKNAQGNETKLTNEVNEASDVQNEYVPAPTTTSSTSTTTSTTTTTTSTTTTTTAPWPKTKKDRPARRRPGNSRKTNQSAEEVDQDIFLKVDPTTFEYRNETDSTDSGVPATYVPDVNQYSEEPFIKSTSATRTSTSSEETSATDLKTILKQQNGPLSLSELLQMQNLSLAEFLKNRKEAALLLSGKRGTHTTSPRPDHHRTNFSSKSRPFSKNRQDSEAEESKSVEREKSAESTERYNGFVPKNPRIRFGHFKGVYPTVKSGSKTDGKLNESKSPSKHSQDSHAENTSNQVEVTEATNRTRGEFKHVPKRFNDMRLKLRIHRRKYNPFSTTTTTTTTTTTSTTAANIAGKDEKLETTTLPTTTVIPSETPTTTSTTTQEPPTTKRLALRTPFKSTNNPELSLILPTRNKTDEKPEKRERFTNYASRLQTIKKTSQEKEEHNVKESIPVQQTVPTKSFDFDEPKLPLDDIDMDEDQEPYDGFALKGSSENSNEGKEKSGESKRVEAVGKIPPPSELQKYESKDEILELLKPGSNSDRLQRILESRNMTVKELLENREKSSLQSNFTQLFHENDVRTQRGNEARITTTTTTDIPEFKVFQSLPDFEPIHRNLFQKNVKELKSNSYPDSQVDESRPVSVQTRPNSTSSERGSKKAHGVVEVKRKLQLNSESEGRESFEGNDGVLERWNTRDKVLYFNPFPNLREKPTPAPTITSNLEKYAVNDKTENEVPESDIILLETIKRSQEANRKLKSNINEILQEQSEVKDLTNDMDKSFIPPAVKSAIIASGVVMGLALFVFVAIFAACGWKQRQIRLRARSSILNDALAKSDSEKKVQRTNALSPVNFKQSSVYKKSLEVDDESSSSASLSSNGSSYLWNSLKNTFTGRNTTLKNRLDKEDKTREERLEGLKSVLRNHETRRSDLLVEEDPSEERYCSSSSMRRQEERYSLRKSDCVKKSPSFTSTHNFSSCTHGH